MEPDFARSSSDRGQRLARYPLLDALIERRSRRFAKGMRLNGGPLAHESRQRPLPLTLEEEAALAFAACGVTGYALAELPYQSGDQPEAGGGNIMTHFIGRTVGSGDAMHAVTVFVINDGGVWMLRVPTFNKWWTNVPGTTYFPPVNELSALYINILLSAFDEEFAYFIVDEHSHFRPAGIAGFGRSRGGRLHDDPRDGWFATVGFIETWLYEFAAIEQGGILQNLGLMTQALGLGALPISPPIRSSGSRRSASGWRRSHSRGRSAPDR